MTGIILALLIWAALTYWLAYQTRRQYMLLQAQRLDPAGRAAYRAHDSSIVTGQIVMFGDSRGAAWPAPAGYTMINRSISGQSSAECLLRLEAHVLPLQPRQVVIQLGVNDLKAVALFPKRRDTIITNCQANLRDIVRHLTAAGSQVVLCTIFPPGDIPFYRIPFWSADIIPAILSTNAYLKTLASDQVIILDAYTLLTDPATGRVYPQYQYDFLHLNTAGYERLNEALIPLLTP